jgi:disulfide oxidoreductase YuzD
MTSSEHKKIAYIIKKTKNKTVDDILMLDALLKNKYPKHKFKIICIYSKLDDPLLFKRRKKINKISPTIDFFPVDFFSPVLLSWAGDLNGWQRLFLKYPLKSKKIKNSHRKNYFSTRFSSFLLEKQNKQPKQIEYYLALSQLYKLTNRHKKYILNLQRALNLMNNTEKC